MARIALLLCIIFFVLSLQSPPKIIYFELYNQHKMMPYIKLKIGTPSVEINFKLSTKHSVLYVNNDEKYDSNESISYKSQGNTPNHPLIHIPKDCFSIGKEKVAFSHITITSMPIVIVDKENNFQDTLGIGYLMPESKSVEGSLSEYSFLYQLKINQYIDMEIISIQSFKDTYLLSIGNYPTEVKTMKNKYKRCKLIPTTPLGGNNPFYQCLIDSFYFKDNSILPIKAKVTWLITGKTIRIPMRIFDFVINKYFESAISDNQCSLQGIKNGRLSCLSSYYNSNLDIIGLIIGKWNIKLYYDELFIANITNERKFLIFEGVFFSNDQDTIEIGVNIFKRHLAIFNKEEGEFGLIDKDTEEGQEGL